MAEQKLNVTFSADNTELKQALEESTNKLLEVGVTGKDAMERTANAVDQVVDSVKQSTKAITEQQSEFKEANEAAKKQEKYLKNTTKVIKEFGRLAQKAFNGIYEELLKVGDAADKIGVSVNGFQILQTAAQNSKEDISTVSAAVQNVGKNALAALSGDQGAIGAFAKLGISIDELKGKNPEQLFDLTTSACYALGDSIDGPEGTAAKTKIFGNSFKDLNGFIREYRQMTDGGLQGAFSEEAVRQAQELKKGMDDLKATLIAIAVDSGFISWLNNVVSSLREIASLKKLISDSTNLYDKGAQHNQNLSKWRHVGAFALDVINPVSWVQNGADKIGRFFNVENPLGRSLGKYLMGFEAEGVEFYSPAPSQETLKQAKQRHAQYVAERQTRTANIQQYTQTQEALAATSKIEKEQAEATKKALSDAERTYDAAQRRLEAANKQVDALEAAAEQQRAAAYIAQKSAKVDAKARNLEKFAFQPIKRRKNARLDASIAEKLELQAAGEKVKFTREEKRRMKKREKAADALEKAQKELAKAQEQQKKRLEKKQQDALNAARQEQQAAIKAQSDAANKLATLTSVSNDRLLEISSGIQKLATRVYIVK